MRKVKYDTGIWYFYPEEKTVYFAGMLGDEEHKLRRDALKVITDKTASDVADGTVEKAKEDGKVILYFLSRIETKPDAHYISMAFYVSKAYGRELVNTLKEYSKEHKMELRFI